MGRKGVSKRKKVKGAPDAGSHSVSIGRKAENQPEQVAKKGMPWSKDNKKR
jgi:hypothetical protein